MIHIYENNQLIGYGGNQEWFEDSWAQKAGCASVLASHLYTYYLSLHRLSKKEFLKSHEYFDEDVQDFEVGIFNLGYLPGGNHECVTQYETTLKTIEKLWNI